MRARPLSGTRESLKGSAMLLRLLLALLVAALPLPAMASAGCHVQPATVSAHHGAPAKHAPAPVAVEMLCVGCIAPATVRAPMLAEPIGFAAPRSPGVILTGLPLASMPPATPPPRSEA